jgi:hypothetical protein
MSRRLLSTALALVMAGGVYLAAGNAEASNMGFKLERSFSFITGAQNLYFVSFPLFNGLGDVSDNTSCTGSDGIVNASDALCDLATSKDTSAGGGLMTMQKLDEGSCLLQGRTLLKVGANFQFVGGFTEELTTAGNREIGYIINVNKNAADPDLENRAVIVGSHDPSWAGKMVSRTCPYSILNLPYHTMYRTANEVLCGLQGVDWNPSDPGDPGSDPDACDAGLFDPVSGVSVTVQTFVNEVGGGFRGRTAFSVAGTPRFVGNNFDLTPGDAYLFNMNTGYQDRLWLPPHF